MAEHPTWRRRLAALAVLGLASGALIATSPARIQSSLEASHSSDVELTLDTPRVTGRVVLELSANALPAPGDQRLRVSGTVDFYQRNQNAAVRMSVRAVDVDAAPAERDGSTSWPIEQLCRVAEQCQREFEVTFEWLDPEPGTTQRASFEATVRIVYDQVENNPEGATAGWSETAAFAPAPVGAVLAAGTNPERITLDQAHPAVIRHVVLTAAGIAEATRTVAVVDSSATGSGAEAVRFTIIPDTPGEGDAERAPSAAAIDPFAGCPSTGDCERGVTVLIELAEADRDATIEVEWSLRAEAEFPPESERPDGAELSAAVDSSVDVGPDTPVLPASASDNLEPGPDETGTVRSFTRVVITADDATFRLGTSGALPPPALGVLTIRATDEATIDVHVSGAYGTIDAYPSLQLGASRLSATVLVYPFRWCTGEAVCTAQIDRRHTRRAATGRSRGNASAQTPAFRRFRDGSRLTAV